MAKLQASGLVLAHNILHTATIHLRQLSTASICRLHRPILGKVLFAFPPQAHPLHQRAMRPFTVKLQPILRDRTIRASSQEQCLQVGRHLRKSRALPSTAEATRESLRLTFPRQSRMSGSHPPRWQLCRLKRTLRSSCQSGRLLTEAELSHLCSHQTGKQGLTDCLVASRPQPQSHLHRQGRPQRSRLSLHQHLCHRQRAHCLKRVQVFPRQCRYHSGLLTYVPVQT